MVLWIVFNIVEAKLEDCITTQTYEWYRKNLVDPNIKPPKSSKSIKSLTSAFARKNKSIAFTKPPSMFAT